MQTLWKNTRAYRTLETESAKNQLGHAYLLITDDKRNLTTALKTFVKPLFACHDPQTDKEERISSLIDGENFADCHFYLDKDKRFSVEDAEKIAEECTLQPVEGEIKVFVIGDFSDATAPAQNKLLKLLEEPPQGVKFMLGATKSHAVLPTVLSRVSKLEIPPFSVEQVSEALNRIYGNRFDKEEYKICATASAGTVGSAQEMLENGAYKGLLLEAFTLCLGVEKRLPAIVKKVGETKRKKELLSLISLIFRDGLVAKRSGISSPYIFLQSERENIQKVATRYSLTALLKAQEYIAQAEEELYFNAVFNQCLETLMAKIYKENGKR